MKEDWVQPIQLLNDKRNHKCEIPYKPHAYGAAITDCYEDDNFNLFVDNGEYGSQVNFCPVCGYEAKNRIKE